MKETKQLLLSSVPGSPSNGHNGQQASMAPSEVVSLVQRTLQPEMSRRMEARQRMDDAAVRSAVGNRNRNNGSVEEKASCNGDEQR